VTPESPVIALTCVWQSSVMATGHAAGVGIDLVEVGPLRDLLVAGGQSFLDAVWTELEQQGANKQPLALAGKWAAKEAVMKALQHGIGEMEPLDVEIVTTAVGAPQVQLYRAARTIAERLQVMSWHLSVTHEGNWAAAIAVASLLPPQDLNESVGNDNERRTFD
jgi:holo-[acyl-carrier protein] synthase